MCLLCFSCSFKSFCSRALPSQILVWIPKPHRGSWVINPAVFVVAVLVLALEGAGEQGAGAGHGAARSLSLFLPSPGWTARPGVCRLAGCWSQHIPPRAGEAGSTIPTTNNPKRAQGHPRPCHAPHNSTSTGWERSSTAQLGIEHPRTSF